MKPEPEKLLLTTMKNILHKSTGGLKSNQFKEEVFEEIYSAAEEEYGKPHPGVYLTTAKKLQLKPQEFLVLEDSLNGVIAAKAAQMKCLAIPELFPDYHPKYIIADLVMKSLSEVNNDIWEKINHL